MQIGGAGDTNYKLRDGSGKASGLQTFLLGPALRAKLQVVSDFRHTRREILSLLVKDEEKQMTRLLHLFKPLFAWEHPFLKSCQIFNLPRSKLLLGATLDTVVTFSNPVVTSLIAWLKLFAHFKRSLIAGVFLWNSVAATQLKVIYCDLV